MFLRRPQLPDLPNSSPTLVFQTAPVLALCVPQPTYSFGDMSQEDIKIMNSRLKKLLHRCKTLLPRFLFFQLLMISCLR